MRVLVAMSGGVDSSVAAALLVEEGHEVTGATMRLWGGPSDSGCCSASEVIDARRVADELGIRHHVFNYADEFDVAVVAHFVESHRDGRTPNPCVECNRQVKFGAFLDRAMRLGFDAIATGHYAQVHRDGHGTIRLQRGVDHSKDQSYVLSVLTERELDRVLLPVGGLTKTEVREVATRRGLRTAAKPDSQDLCFISQHDASADRSHFLGERIELHQGSIVEGSSGNAIGAVDAIELVTVGQRRGLGRSIDGERQYAVSVDVAARKVVVGTERDLVVRDVALIERTWVNGPIAMGSVVDVQTAAHGLVRSAVTTADGVSFIEPSRRVAPGQVVACYVGESVVGSGIAN